MKIICCKYAILPIMGGKNKLGPFGIVLEIPFVLSLKMLSAIRKITFSRYNDYTSQHFRNLKILKLNDNLKLQELLFMHDFEKNQLPKGLNWLFQRIGNVHNRLTHLSSARGLHTQEFNTTAHGLSKLSAIHLYQST